MDLSKEELQLIYLGLHTITTSYVIRGDLEGTFLPRLTTSFDGILLQFLSQKGPAEIRTSWPIRLDNCFNILCKNPGKPR